MLNYIAHPLAIPMISFVDRIRSLRKQYILFIGTVILTIVAGQIVIHYDLNQQNEDARLINIAGRQRMLSQRISKLALYIQQDFQEVGHLRGNRIDTLRYLTSHWQKIHLSLKRGSSEFGLSDRRTPQIDSLLSQIDIPLKVIVTAANSLVTNPTREQADSTVLEISRAEQLFLKLMEKTVQTYQFEAEQKLKDLKRIEFALAGVSIVILLLEFWLIFVPIIRRLEANNTSLISLNNDLKSAEEELRSNLDYVTLLQTEIEARERQYREVIEGASDMIYELNQDGKFTFVNPVMESLTGYSREELMQKYFYEIIDESHRNEIIDFYKYQRNNRQELSYLEVPVLSKRNDVVWVGQNVRMFFKENWVWKVSVIARDITDRKGAENALRESESKFRTLAEHAPIAIFQTTDLGQLVYVNRLWQEISGITFNPSNPDDWARMINKDDLERVLKLWTRCVQEKLDFNVEFRLEHPQQGTRWVHSRATRLDLESEHAGFIGTMTDVTELRRAQLKLVESEKLYREISEHSADIIAIFDLENRYTYVSPAVEFVLGYKPEELIGRKGDLLVHAADLPNWKVGSDVTNLESKTSTSTQFRLKRKDGTYVWIEALSNPIHDHIGRVAAIQTINRDITERKEVELAMKEAKEKAEEATRAKSQFLSMMSHEIRTPLNAVIGLSNILMDEKPRPDQLEHLQLLKFSGENLLSIINDILDFSKIEAGKISLESVAFNLKDLFTKTVQMFEYRAADKGLKLKLRYDEKLPSFFSGDPVRISQVATNLIGNAVKFTEQGVVDVNVKGVERSGGFYQINVKVKDTGIGIEQESLNRIFESFAQANATTTRKFGGTGLGLSITRKLLNLMGSEIRVESTVGFGSTFQFDLNLKVADEIVKQNEQSLTSDHVGFSGRKVKVLLVEDNRVNQVVALNFLKKWGMTTDVANNGLEALALVKTKQHHIVLMDLQMPEMDGYEAARKIREMEDSYFRDLPIIALTASAMMDIRDKVKQFGMSDFISKPFQPQDLYDKLVQHLSVIDFTVKSAHEEATRTKRKRTFDLNLYTEGNEEFKKEFAGLLINNINELTSSLDQAVASGDGSTFSSVSHKVKTTIGMLGDEEFGEVVTRLKDLVVAQRVQTNEFINKRKQFDNIAREIIEGLQEQL